MAGSPSQYGDDEPIASINVVPLVDIILVVLIIFMVTAPLVLKPVIDVNLPKAASGEVAPSSPFNISVTAGGLLSLNGKSATLAEINAYAVQLAKDKPESAAILMADKSVTLEKLTEVIDSIKTSGIKRVAFSIDKKPGTK
jgi:biopolymer transport protein ExbD